MIFSLLNKSIRTTITRRRLPPTQILRDLSIRFDNHQNRRLPSYSR